MEYQETPAQVAPFNFLKAVETFKQDQTRKEFFASAVKYNRQINKEITHDISYVIKGEYYPYELLLDPHGDFKCPLDQIYFKEFRSFKAHLSKTHRYKVTFFSKKLDREFDNLRTLNSAYKIYKKQHGEPT